MLSGSTDWLVVLGAGDDAGVLGTVELDVGAVELDVGAVELDAGAVELDAGVLGAVELDAGVLGDAEEHVVVGKNCPRVSPEACASTWTKHLPSADSSSGTVTPSPWLGPMSRSEFH
ncbi:MAG TPA: hypothetical protein VF612_02200 [Jatrophihabitans sp.]|uniref:hypothetical protein n=1 Tax=Jatrophihabitans sp. TaxID=1932789 RepID=UPI002F126F02